MRALLIAPVLSLAFAAPVLASEYDALFKAKKYPEIEKQVASKLAAEPNNADALNAKVRLILIEGKDSRLDEAAKIAEQCIAANPKSSDCQESLGNVLGTKATNGSMFAAMSYAGKIRDAFKKAVELDPANFSARVSLLQYYMMAPGIAGGGKDKARELIAESAKFNATAGALLQASYDLAEKDFEKAATAALAADPGEAEEMAAQRRSILSNAGHQYIEKKKFAEAEKLFREVMVRYPDSYMGYFGMGKLLQEQGKAKDALPLLEKSLQVNAVAAAHYRIGKCWQLLGDKVKAIAAYEKAIAFQPELPKSAKGDAEDQLRALRKS